MKATLYALKPDKPWDDRGTGDVSISYVDRLKGKCLLVRSESDDSLLLEIKIQPDTTYRKQEDTLIVWPGEDEFDLALSFQEKEKCDEIWEQISEVQKKNHSVEITQDTVEKSKSERLVVLPFELPSCEISNLEDINKLFEKHLAFLVMRINSNSSIIETSYLRKLINVFHMCEDLNDIEGLHHLYNIFKKIFMIKDNALLEAMLSDELIFGVVGCLEYDPSSSTQNHYREDLKQQAMFRENIPIKNAELLSKIHLTFRAQYILDVVLSRSSSWVKGLLSAFISNNKIHILLLIQEDAKFLTELFTMLTDMNTLDSNRRDLLLFLKEFCHYSQSIDCLTRETFYKTLTSFEVLAALEITLAMNDQKVKTASIDVLTYIVDFSPTVIREYILDQANNTVEDKTLLNIIVEQMICDNDSQLDGAVLLMDILRILLDPENMFSSVNESHKTDFLNLFYKHSVQILIAPLMESTTHDEPQREDSRSAQHLGLILELLSFCVNHHTDYIKNFILDNDLLRRVLVLMKSKHKFLVLCALRFMRKLIALKDEVFNRYIIEGNHFAPVVDAFVQNKGRYNMLDSAIIEMFEFINVKDIKILCSHVVETYGKSFDNICYVRTFNALKQERNVTENNSAQKSTINSNDVSRPRVVIRRIQSQFFKRFQYRPSNITKRAKFHGVLLNTGQKTYEIILEIGNGQITLTSINLRYRTIQLTKINNAIHTENRIYLYFGNNYKFELTFVLEKHQLQQAFTLLEPMIQGRSDQIHPTPPHSE
ncbi:hypothetical protein Zmor_010427 [Zophobas morio]|uniref:WH1 domain-containing protein n=2 Tax=Zophobas morio TaxID=2755281 RepID=A0AA38MJZ0_9CUCU|nr:hypothetical protein Zmor_010427 [Zophobas morio]